MTARRRSASLLVALLALAPQAVDAARTGGAPRARPAATARASHEAAPRPSLGKALAAKRDAVRTIVKSARATRRAQPERAIARATPRQRLIGRANVVLTGAAIAGLVAGGAVSTIGGALTIAGVVGLTWVVADAGAALVHHFLDNINPARVRVLWPGKVGQFVATQAEDFQNHHDHQRDVVFREYFEHTAVTQAIALPVLAGMTALAWTVPGAAPVVAALTTLGNLSSWTQEFHRWAHRSPSENGPVITALQTFGPVLTAKLHAKHHRQGHSDHYALTSGSTNRVLDGLKFRTRPGGPKTNVLRKIEVRIKNWQGDDPSAWNETPGLKEEALGLPMPEGVTPPSWR
jgi:ubiquitin-conjugating enzyme E2 variant